MLHSLLLLCTLYAPTASVVLWPATGKGGVGQALNPNDRGPWNKSSPLPNDPGPSPWVVSGPSLNTSAQNQLNSPNSSLEQALWPSLDTYNNVSEVSTFRMKSCTLKERTLTPRLVVSGSMFVMGRSVHRQQDGSPRFIFQQFRVIIQRGLRRALYMVTRNRVRSLVGLSSSTTQASRLVETARMRPKLL